jgi:KDO2-lipid IV(A) lauroyltransferase
LPEVTAAASLEVSAAALNQGVEAAVRSLPAQYLWVYKRFKTRPPGEAKLY